MRNARWLSLYLGLCTALLLPPAWSRPPADSPIRTETGTLQGAPWRIDMPAHWNGELVVYAHGFEPIGTPRPDPWPGNAWTEALTQAGYAVAQSGYSSQGWAVTDAIADLERLRAQFVAQHPDTRHSWIIGFSMGGAVAIGTLERLPQHYSGGVSMCGANLPGDVLAAEMLASLVAFEYFFPDAKGLPEGGLISPAAAAMPQGETYDAIAAAVETNPVAAATLARRLELKPDELAGTISLHTLVFQQLVKRSGGVPVSNQQTVYSGFGDDKAFNAGVRRVSADPAAERKLARGLALTGALQRPLVLQYNLDDPSVTPRFEPVYPALARRAGATSQLAQLPPVGSGHCQFTPQQVLAAVAMQSAAARAMPAASTGEAQRP
jgi:pimeloyl-ACP methyl ester carboxylesterase